MLNRIRIFLDRLQQRLSDFGAALVSPIERTVSAAAGKVLSASEKIDHVESLLGRLLRILTWPLRLIGKILQVLLPTPVYRFFASLGERVQSFFARLGIGILRVAEMLNLDRVVFGLVWLLQPIWRPLAAVGIFWVCWVNTRPYRGALMALPAIGLASLVLGVGTWYSVFGASKIAANYKLAVRETQDSKDYQLREMYDQKLAQLGVDTQRTQFNTAIALAQDQKLQEAYEQMRELAPEDHPGYPNAHFWLVQSLISGQLEEKPDEARRLAWIHLEHLKSLEIESSQLKYIEALLLKQENKLEEAAKLLESASSQIAGAAYESMIINRSLKRLEKAKQDARMVVTHMKSRSRGNRELSAIEYQQWLAAEELLGNLTEMRKLLEKWLELEPDSQRAASLLAKVYRRQAGTLLRAPLPDQKTIVELWLKAAKLDNRPDALLSLARALYAERDATPVYSQLLAALYESPNTPVSLLVAIGTEAAQNQQYAEARPFFAAAVEREDSNSIAWNNYALVLAEGQDPQLDEALTAVNKAVEAMPKEHRFRETRGQILLKLDRWQEAIEDLEYALNGLPELTAIHESLSVAYAALGQEELAELHKMQAN